MGKKEENTGFKCIVCHKYVMPLRHGSYRNHCPFCLASLHVDELVPGDRESACHGIMKAYCLKFSGKKGWQIGHKCLICGEKKWNKVAEGDAESDDWEVVVRLSHFTEALL